MGEYEDLYRELRYWKNEVRRLRREKRKWENRRKEVENVQKSLKSAANNNSSDVNWKMTKTGDQLDRAIDYPAKESAMDSIFSGKRESSVYGDSDLFNASSSLQNEIEICERKISELRSSLNSAEEEVARIQREIRSLIWD